MAFWRTGNIAILFRGRYPAIFLWIFTLDNGDIWHLANFSTRNRALIRFLVEIGATINSKYRVIHPIGPLRISTAVKISGQKAGAAIVHNWIFVIIFIIANLLKIIITYIT